MKADRRTTKHRNSKRLPVEARRSIIDPAPTKERRGKSVFVGSQTLASSPHPESMPAAFPRSPLDRYFRILEILSSFPAGITQSQIAEVIGLPKTTVHRLLRGLAEIGLVELGQKRSGLCKVGPRLMRMLYAGAPDSWIETLAYPILKGLADIIGEMCIISKLSEKTIRVVAMVEPENSAKGYVVPPRELWPHATASAKAILAFLPEAKAISILPSPIPVLTNKTKTKVPDILEEYRQIRNDHIALCAGEDVPGFAAIACPIHLESGVIYSVCITGTMQSIIEENTQRYGELLKKCSERLSAAIQMRLSQGDPSGPRL